MERIINMICVFCNKEFKRKGKGDHIIAQGLGVFKPELSIYCICPDCDSLNGRTFESIFLRTGFIGFFRALKHIKSKNNKKEIIKNPLMNKFKVVESKIFSLYNLQDPFETHFFDEDGNLYTSNRIRVLKNEKTIDIIRVPVGISRNIREICNFFEAKTSEKIDGIKYYFEINKNQNYKIINELKARNIKIENFNKIKLFEETQTFKIECLITINHFRFIVYTVLKAMLFLKYPKSLLEPMINFVKTGKEEYLYCHYIDDNKSGFNYNIDPPLNIFFHVFEWVIYEKFFKISASIFKCENLNGLKFGINVKRNFGELTDSNNKIISNGKIIAKYEKDSFGTLELFQNNILYEIK